MKEAKYSSRLDQLLGDPIFWRALFRVSPAVTCYLQSLPVLTLGGVRPGVPQASWDDVGKFGILCLEVLICFLLYISLRCSVLYINDHNRWDLVTGKFTMTMHLPIHPSFQAVFG